MSCFEGLEMGLNLEVLRPEVDALYKGGLAAAAILNTSQSRDPI